MGKKEAAGGWKLRSGGWSVFKLDLGETLTRKGTKEENCSFSEKQGTNVRPQHSFHEGWGGKLPSGIGGMVKGMTSGAGASAWGFLDSKLERISIFDFRAGERKDLKVQRRRWGKGRG